MRQHNGGQMFQTYYTGEQKMKKLIAIGILLLVCFNLTAEPGDLVQRDLSYEVIENDRAISVAFYGAEWLKNWEAEKAATEMREPKTISPVQIFIRVTAGTIESAVIEKWLFILLNGKGQEIYRSYGPRFKLPDIGAGIYRTTWTSIHYILLEVEPECPLKLRVVSPDGKPTDITIKKK
jgi:hypothetical protein